MKKLFIIIGLVLMFVTKSFAEIKLNVITEETKYAIWTAFNEKGLKYEFKGIKDVKPGILTPEMEAALISGSKYGLQYAITDSEEETLGFLKFDNGKFILEVYKIY